MGLFLAAMLCLRASRASAGLRCPEGCQCDGDIGGGTCGEQAVCRRLDRFPDVESYPNKLDCLFVHSPKLRKLSQEEMAAGLKAIPSSVRLLDLSESRLRNLPEEGLGHLPELRVLNLEFNELRRLPQKAFHGLRRLKVLWLTGNHYGPDEPEFKRMRRAGNRLEALHEHQFRGLEGLQVLLLHHNRLTALPGAVFRGLKRLRVLKLLDNPFRPEVTAKHPAFAEANRSVLRQLDLQSDSGDSLEDYWEETGTQLSDDFDLQVPGPSAQHLAEEEL